MDRPVSAHSVLIVPPLMHPEGPHTALLRAAGFDIRRPPPGVVAARPEHLAAIIGDAEAAIVGTEPYTREVILGAPRLRAIVRCGVGYDAIDLRTADERGIAVATTPGTNHEAVAEHALAMMLALARGFPRRDFMVRRGEPWQKVPMPRIAKRTLGLLGLGRIAQALVSRIGGLQLRVLAYAPRPDRRFAATHGIQLVTLEDVLRQSDFLSLHLPLTPETRNLISGPTLALMKPGAILINTSRGGLVDERALYDALADGRLAGAGLDVFAEEPPAPDNPLLQLDNVLLSPHIAGLDSESYRDLQVMAARILIDLAEGRWSDGCVVNLRGVKDWRW
jgi:D-3-phosphoglycerate dehydrogenase / 2-oxoglutarate reductase